MLLTWCVQSAFIEFREEMLPVLQVRNSVGLLCGFRVIFE